MEELIGSKIKRSIDEKNLEIKSEQRITLKIYNLTVEEYNRFIEFVKTKTPNKKGYEAIKILMNSFNSSIDRSDKK